MDKPTIYTVTVWFKDRMGQEHEKAYQFNQAEIASEFQFETLTALTKLRKMKQIGAHTVKVAPPLPH